MRLRQLLTAAVSGNPDEVKAILDRDSSLVHEKLDEGQFVTDPAGYKYNLKPYQAALSVDDTQIAKLIKSYFQDEKDKANNAEKQHDEQCPNGWEKTEEEKWGLIFAQLDNLTLAIRNSKTGDITSSDNPDFIVTVKQGSLVETELHEFWRLLDAKKDEVITAGKKPFNPHSLLKAWQTYDDNTSYQECFGGRWDDPGALLFWQKVIGYDGIQRCMPVNYVQAFHDRLEATVKKLQNDQPQDRATQFYIYSARTESYSTVDFYPLRARGTTDFNFAIYATASAEVCDMRGLDDPSWDEWAVCFRSLCQSKTACAQSLHSTETSALTLSQAFRDD